MYFNQVIYYNKRYVHTVPCIFINLSLHYVLMYILVTLGTIYIYIYFQFKQCVIIRNDESQRKMPPQTKRKNNHAHKEILSNTHTHSLTHTNTQIENPSKSNKNR